MNKNEVIRRAEARLSKTVSLTDAAMAEELREHFPEAFEDEKPLDRWYVGSDKLFVFEGKDVRYGINRVGKWFCSDRVTSIYPTHILATDEEVLERLSAYAKKQGYKEGVIISQDNLPYATNPRIELGSTIGNGGFSLVDNHLCFDLLSIMQDGKWADIIEEPKQEPIHPLEKALNDLEARIEQLESDYALNKLC